jgi:hypothetical protein
MSFALTLVRWPMWCIRAGKKPTKLPVLLWTASPKLRYQHEMPQDTNGRNFVPKGDLARYCHGEDAIVRETGP